MPVDPTDQEHATPSDATAAALLETIRQLLAELRPHSANTLSVSLESSLERDLGFDSLGRVELFERVERTFRVRLPEPILMSAETPHEVLRAIQSAPAPAAPPLRSAPATRASSAESRQDESLTIPSQGRTLMEMLQWHVKNHPQRRHMTLYGDADAVEEITYAELYEGAARIATGLRQRDLQPRQTVALMLPTGRSFFNSFFGVLLAGGVPVPIYPPMRPSQIEDHMRRQAGILSNAQTVTMITVSEAQLLARLLQPQVKTLRHVVTAQELETQADPSDAAWPVLHEEDLAFLQYTSGSTGNPKGVMLTHANLMANLWAMMQVADVSSQDVFVSWLPLYHDMGLIGAWLGSLYYGFHLVLMSPLTFLARPERWFAAIHTHRGTISGGPNFAYELCLRRIDEPKIEGYDLSSWRIAFNGAEPISPDTMQHFTERFAPYGFRPEAMSPVYGLAEGTLGLAFSPFEKEPRIDRVQREAFTRTGRALPAADRDANVLRFVSCGHPLPGHQIRIVDATGYELPERQEGQLEFCGPSATSGYFRNPEDTRRLYHDAWVRSGDRAYIAEGEVFITGREKDLIIRAGRNIYPHELEEAVGAIEGIRKGCVAAFGSTDLVSGTERLVVLAETRETSDAVRAALRTQIDACTVDLLGAPPDDVILAPPQSVLKTSSGKIRRSATRERYERGDIGARPSAMWRQVLRLAVASLWPQVRRSCRAALDIAYGLYVWGVFSVLAAVIWVLLAVLPKRAWRQYITHKLTLWLLRLVRIPLSVRGLEHLPAQSPYVLVCNHASYMDAVVLVAALPPHLRYVAKRELANRWIPRLLFNWLGTEFVARFDAQQGRHDIARVLEAVKGGTAVVFFPEGTFGREPGLRPFRMGAFMVAAQAGVPVVPTAIRGTRSILRSGQWLPRHGTVRLSIGAPLQPQGTDWEAAIALRDASHADMLRNCGEPALHNPAEESVLTPPLP